MSMPPQKKSDPVVEGFTHIRNQRLRACLCALRELRLMIQWLAFAAFCLFGQKLAKWLETLL